MIKVLVIEFDETLRGALHELLSMDGHYEVAEVNTETAALAYLRVHAERMIVVCSNRDADHHLTTAFFAGVVADADLARRTCYLLLSTNPKIISPALQASLAHLGAAILPKPFEAEALLTAVREAAERLAASHTK